MLLAYAPKSFPSTPAFLATESLFKWKSKLLISTKPGEASIDALSGFNMMVSLILSDIAACHSGSDGGAKRPFHDI